MGNIGHCHRDMIHLKSLVILGMGVPMPGQRHVRPFLGEEVTRERAGSAVFVEEPAHREFRLGVESRAGVVEPALLIRESYLLHYSYEIPPDK